MVYLETKWQGSAVAEVGIVTWAGGGNVTVALGIGAALVERGHDVTVAGPNSLRSAILEMGLGFRELGPPPPRDPAQRGEYLRQIAGSTSLARELEQLLVGMRPELLVIDCNLSWALQWARQARSNVRTAVLVHTALGLYLPAWQAVIDAVNRQRGARGQATLAAAREAWSGSDLLLVASLRHFDRPPDGMAPTYVGPVFAPQPAGRVAAAGDVGGPPTVLVSYSTDALQNKPGRLQTALDALADLPVRVFASTCGLYPANQLSVPDNARVSDYLPLADVLNKASVMVCHAGHGTTMAALTHGVPLVCVPGLGREQAPIAERVAELGLGRAVEPDARAGDITEAVDTVLTDPGYRTRVQQFARRAGRTDGAARAAADLEAVLRRAN